MSRKLIGLVMIVRDEEAVLERCLQSLLELELVDAWTICDTGSTDDTRGVARRMLGHLPGRVYRHTWQGFGPNRTQAIARARGSAEWLLMLDADFTVDAFPNLRKWLGRGKHAAVDAFDVEVHDHGLNYWLPLLVRGELEWRYVGATHEYLDVDRGRAQKLRGLTVDHHGDGSSTPDKLERDLLLLKPELDAGDPRATFYAAQTLRYLGRDGPAAMLYDRRAGMGGWEEEAWYSRYQAARLRQSIPELLAVWNERPWRHEPLSAAAALAAADPRAVGDRLFLEPL